MMKKLSLLMAGFLMLLMIMGTPGAIAAGSKDVLVVGMATSDIISLDPAKAFEFSGVGIDAQIYDRLLDFPAGKFDKPEFSLAKSFNVSPDGAPVSRYSLICSAICTATFSCASIVDAPRCGVQITFSMSNNGFSRAGSTS